MTTGSADDRVWNGADDDGSGTVALMAIARAFAEGPRPKRSLLFVWHAGEERGLVGSRYFADYPPVPIEHIVAQLNIDMIGRNRDDKAAEANTVYLVGSDRISSELHEINRDANRALPQPLTLDYEMNDPADIEQIYYRSDHYSYAAKGIPIIFFTTGLHDDYHANTDEVSKIEFAKMTRVAQLVYETGLRVGQPRSRARARQPRAARRQGHALSAPREPADPTRSYRMSENLVTRPLLDHLSHDLRQPRRLRHHRAAAAVLRGDVRRVAARDRAALCGVLAVPAVCRAGSRRLVRSLRPAAGAHPQPRRHRRQLRDDGAGAQLRDAVPGSRRGRALRRKYLDGACVRRRHHRTQGSIAGLRPDRRRVRPRLHPGAGPERPRSRGSASPHRSGRRPASRSSRW